MTLTIIPRSRWVPPGPAVTGPARRRPFQQGVVHWEGVNRDRTPADIAGHIRSMHQSWVRSRGFSLGYGFVVVSDMRHPDDGTCWEVRGFDLNMASNPGSIWTGQPSGNANDWTGSVLLVGPTGFPASAAAAATVSALFADWHRQAGTAPVRPFPHSTLDATACCGDAYRSDLNAGRFDPATGPVTPPTTPPPALPTEGDPDMYLIDVRPSASAPSAVVLRADAKCLYHVTNGHAVDIDVVFGVRRGELSAEQVVNMLRDRQSVGPSPFTGAWASDALHDAWLAAADNKR